jgi:CBS domain-containing protein
MKAEEIMQKNVITIHKDKNVEDVARILTENKISGVPVVNDNNKLIGIVTEGDLLHKKTNPRMPDFFSLLGGIIYFNGTKRYQEDFKKLIAVKAHEIMTREVISVSKDMEVSDIANKMVNNNINRVPVVEDDKIIGIISRADIIKILVKE